MKPKKQEMSEENKEKRGRKSGGLIQMSELEAHAEHIVGKFNENKQLPWGS